MKYSADTSFIIGLFVDEPRTAAAKDMFNRLKATREKVFIPAHTIVEVIYVLEKFYKLDRVKVAEYSILFFEGLTSYKGLIFRNQACLPGIALLEKEFGR